MVDRSSITYKNKINHYFKLSDRNTTIKKEIIGGISTFLAMMYILAVNPGMLTSSSGLTGIENANAAIFLGVAISSFVSTFFMGLFANVPIALAPGMGINAFFAFTVASTTGFGMDYFQALICVFLSGFLYTIIAVTPLRSKISRAIPSNMKLIIGVMIGFFLAFVGLDAIGIIKGSSIGAPTSLGGMFNPTKNANYHIVIIGTLTLIIGIILHFAKVKHSIIVTAFVGLLMMLIAYGINPNQGDIANSVKIQDYQGFGDFGVMLQKTFNGHIWAKTLSNPLAYVAIFTFLYMDFFDTSGSLFALEKLTNLNLSDTANKKNKNVQKINMVDGAGTIFGSLMLNSSVTTFVESGAGVLAGARTGLASICTGILFLLSILIWPLMGPFMPVGSAVLSFQPITGPIIVITGILMISQISHFNFKKKLDIPVLGITVLFGMLGFSISTGFSFGVFFYYAIHSVSALSEYLINKKLNKNAKFEKSTDLNGIMLGLFCISILFIIIEILIKAGIFN